ncbi:MAG: META domain-containing protein [Candidatus Promineifilaceae bacterium]|nr:META domain-containing protein [Candidatus Promineifilaceae bacterium]
MKKVVFFTVLCLSVFILAGCGSGSEGDASSSNSITGVSWQWQSVTNQTTSETTTVPNPENYTIEFNDDGTFTGQADCNQIAGTYSTESGFSITLGPSTLAFCGEASLDTVYLDLLSNVAAGGPDGAGGLELETAGGEQRMLFNS